MKALKVIGILALGYVAIVVIFESLLGYMQPQGEQTIVISTMNDEGETSGRVVSRLESNGQLYVAVNHWPRMWYYRLLDNPNVKVTIDDVTGDYLAVPVDGEEHDQVQADNPTGLVFRLLTGFPPRYFVRLQPASA